MYTFHVTGKSRADLWAFAALVAVEYAMETNNMVCSGTYLDHTNPERYQCHHDIGTPECLVEMKKLTFKTGRRDCKPTAPMVDGSMCAFGTANNLVGLNGAHTL